MIEVLRREEKYLLGLDDAYRYRHLFSQMLSTDAYSKEGSYMVRSLYFDTPDDKDYYEKLTEQPLRRKIRLRIYHPTNTHAKLELKQKENQFQKKRSLSITKEDALSLIDGNYGVLLNYPDAFAAELYVIMSTEVYRPRSIVEYQRQAFMAKENNIRLTFDSQICATESSFDLFSDNLPLYPVFPLERVIFEVKYDKFLLGYISDMISRVNTRTISCSKYCYSRRESQNYE